MSTGMSVSMHPSSDTTLPHPELYITSKVVWRSLVNVDSVKAAVQKLREINWLYSEVKSIPGFKESQRNCQQCLDSVLLCVITGIFQTLLCNTWLKQSYFLHPYATTTAERSGKTCGHASVTRNASGIPPSAVGPRKTPSKSSHQKNCYTSVQCAVVDKLDECWRRNGCLSGHGAYSGCYWAEAGTGQSHQGSRSIYTFHEWDQSYSCGRAQLN